MWQANAGGRYRHKNDRYVAPLDPNFGGVGRTLTDSEGNYIFRTIAGSLSPAQRAERLAASHIHVSVSGPSISTRLITQLYFEGDPLIPLCPIVKTIANPAAVQTLIARLDGQRQSHGLRPIASTSCCAGSARTRELRRL